MPGPKQNNDHKYHDVNHQPRHKAKFRMVEAKERQEAYNKLSPLEKLTKLDDKLGKDLGAGEQRKRLAKALNKANVPTEEVYSFGALPPSGMALPVVPLSKPSAQVLSFEDLQSSEEDEGKPRKVRAKERRAKERNND